MQTNCSAAIRLNYPGAKVKVNWRSHKREKRGRKNSGKRKSTERQEEEEPGEEEDDESSEGEEVAEEEEQEVDFSRQSTSKVEVRHFIIIQWNFSKTDTP